MLGFCWGRVHCGADLMRERGMHGRLHLSWGGEDNESKRQRQREPWWRGLTATEKMCCIWWLLVLGH